MHRSSLCIKNWVLCTVSSHAACTHRYIEIHLHIIYITHMCSFWGSNPGLHTCRANMEISNHLFCLFWNLYWNPMKCVSWLKNWNENIEGFICTKLTFCLLARLGSWCHTLLWELCVPSSQLPSTVRSLLPPHVADWFCLWTSFLSVPVNCVPNDLSPVFLLALWPTASGLKLSPFRPPCPPSLLLPLPPPFLLSPFPPFLLAQ